MDFTQCTQQKSTEYDTYFALKIEGQHFRIFTDDHRVCNFKSFAPKVWRIVFEMKSTDAFHSGRPTHASSM